MNYLIDTEVLSELFTEDVNTELTDWLSVQQKVLVSTISLERLYKELAENESIREAKWLERFLKYAAEVYPVTSEISKRAGILRGQGYIADQEKAIIAATALEFNLTLVTQNGDQYSTAPIATINPIDK